MNTSLKTINNTIPTVNKNLAKVCIKSIPELSKNIEQKPSFKNGFLFPRFSNILNIDLDRFRQLKRALSKYIFKMLKDPLKGDMKSQAIVVELSIKTMIRFVILKNNLVSYIKKTNSNIIFNFCIIENEIFCERHLPYE